LSEAAENAFQEALRATVLRFRIEEQSIRSNFGRQVLEGSADVDDFDHIGLLERPTRRFLIDAVLRALDWDPDNPEQMVEEARSRSLHGDRLFFDYRGVARSRAPALLVEAKGFDTETPRQPRETEPSSGEMARLISRALGDLKAESDKPLLLAVWSGWLKDLRDYVRSMTSDDQKMLRRVVITAGRWMIIFADPVGAFIDTGVPDPDSIHCLRSLEEIERNSALIFRLLHRKRLVDALPLTLSVREALAVIEPSTISGFFRGVVLSTQMVGPARKRYPSRSVHPAVVFIAGGRLFAVTDYLGDATEEPRDATDLPAYLQTLQTKGDTFEQSTLSRLGRIDLTPSPLDRFPLALRKTTVAERYPPLPESMTALEEANRPERPKLMWSTGERGAVREYLVITGTVWFYKLAAPFGRDCDFHEWPKARAQRVAAAAPHMGGSAISFTASGNAQHCAHEHIQGLRAARCQLLDIDTHLCCRACIFHAVCWEVSDLPELPCPV